uniref:Uncharacterized protein n=1 Tax=Parascaris equorum TaxID=6256 RepID=A0A914RD74_PAREQ
MRIRSALRRRRWLRSNQKLLRSFTSYCTLHSAQNYRLTSALMELLLLLLEVQQDSGNLRHLNGRFQGTLCSLLAEPPNCRVHT